MPSGDDRENQQDRRESQQDRREDQMNERERIAGLERWQLAQNGTLGDLKQAGIRLAEKIDMDAARHDAKLDKLMMFMLTSLVTIVLALGGITVGLIHSLSTTGPSQAVQAAK